MNFPMMSKQAKRRVTSAELAGGLNLRDGPSQCMDNQLTDMVNMWYKNGALRTRPGMRTSQNFKIDYSNDSGFEGYPNFKWLDVTKMGNGKHWRLVCTQILVMCKCDFFWISGDELQTMPTLTTEAINQTVSFAIQHKSTIYVYLKEPCAIYKLESGAQMWEEIDYDDVYAPTVMMQCQTTGTENPEIDGGINVESYNLVGNYYRMQYSTIGTESNPNSTQLAYKLAQPILAEGEQYVAKGRKVTARVFIKGEDVDYTAEFDGTSNKAKSKISNGMYILVDADKYTVIFYKDDNSIAENDCVDEGAIEIKAPYTSTNDEKMKVFGMTKSIWFGGTASGLENGTRIFLCGNWIEENKALIYWSALNDPTYFPEMNYAYVGESNEAVTCFDKQSNKLIIFKENETWYTEYTLNNTFNVSQVIDQETVDLQSQGVYFPLILINGHIGCDCPNSVQLCRNRLVWAHSNGNVYSLISESNYTERSIYVVSEMISNNLKKEFSSIEGKAMEYATSADWNGCYVLAFQNRAYLMDYNSYGYTNVYSYSKTEDAISKIVFEQLEY